jgi:hypothetical protein
LVADKPSANTRRSTTWQPRFFLPSCPLGFRESPVLEARFLRDQDFAYSYRVWITLNKRSYGPLQCLKIDPHIHSSE